MGYDLAIVLSDSNHYGPFVCSICQNLTDLDCLITTTCSHCFCNNCLSQWLNTGATINTTTGSVVNHTNCPACNSNLLFGGNNLQQQQQYQYQSTNNKCMMIGSRACLVQPLQSSQPLAHRLLRMIMVECPLKQTGVPCQWKGDYGDLQDHLLSKTAHTDLESSSTTTIFKTKQQQQSSQSQSSLMTKQHGIHNESSYSTTALLRQEQQQKNKQFFSLALSLKEEANGKYQSQHYQEAKSLYSKAISFLVEQIENNINNNKHNNIADSNHDNNKDDDDDEEEYKEDRQKRDQLLSTLYSNRAATYLNLHEYQNCLTDSNKILLIQQQQREQREQRIIDLSLQKKAYVRACEAYVQLGQLENAKKHCEKGLLDHPQQSLPAVTATATTAATSTAATVAATTAQCDTLSKSLPQKDFIKSLQIQYQKCQRLVELESSANLHLQNQQYSKAKSNFGRLLKEAPSAIPFLLGVAQSDIGLGLTDSALRLTKRVLTQHSQNPQGYWIRGQAVFMMAGGDGSGSGDDFKIGIQLLQEALRFDPDSEPIKKSLRVAKKVKEFMELANSKIFSRQFQLAVDLLTACLQEYQDPIPLPPKSPLYAVLYTKRAEIYVRLKKYNEALKDCAVVLYAQESHIPAWLIKFQAYHGKGDHELALEEVRELLRKFEQQQDLRRAYQQADFLVRRKRRVDYYQLLDVPSVASEMEIKKAYKRKALIFHPDKVPTGSSVKDQQHAQRQFQMLGEALEILCDDFQRRLYDEGYDSNAIRERVEAAKQAAHNHREKHH